MPETKASEPMGEIVGLTVTLEPDTAVRVGDGIELRGSLEFRLVALGAVGQIAAAPNGEALVKALHQTGKRVTIVATRKGNAATELSSEGGAVTVFYNPDIEATGQGGEAWETRPAALGLAHCLVRAEQILRGAAGGNAEEGDQQAVGLEPYEHSTYSENKIRAGWPPPQPPRERY